MNKDTVVASVIGFGLGLIAAVALWIVPKILPSITTSKTSQDQVLSETVAQNSPEPEIGESLQITSPVDGEISKESKIKIQGKAPLDTLVLVTSASENLNSAIGSSGNFSVDLNLKEGANEIAVINISHGKQESQRILVYFTKE